MYKRQGLGLAQRRFLWPLLVYKDQLYVVGGHLAWAAGFDRFRSGDGTAWEQVVEDGFGAGEHRNMGADLVEFEGHLYPVSYTHLRAHETVLDLVCSLLLENKNR